MSSTNRSNAREGHIADYYVTPIDSIKLFLDEFIKIEGNVFKNAAILDPCAGGDEVNQMSYPHTLKTHLGIQNIETYDIRENSRAKIKKSYFDIDSKDKFDVIITNPPFNISLDIIKKALEDVKEGGYVIMLLRLNYFGSKNRKSFWETIMPKYTFVHHKRMSFTESGKTDSIEYAHFVFQKGYTENYAKTYVI